MNVHPRTNNPTEVWKELSKTQKVIKTRNKIPTYPVEDDKLRVVCMSDTHSLTSCLNFSIPDGDIFIHAGDFTQIGKIDEIQKFNDWLGRLPHKHKIVIAGNHELSFDNDSSVKANLLSTFRLSKEDIYGIMSSENAKSFLTNCIYLEDSEVTLYGLKFYGTPWQPEFNKWAFNLPRGDCCLQKWNLIPDDTDILITHSPPLGHGDFCHSKVRAGCVELLTTVQQRVKPKYHVFGHIHEGYGITSDGTTIFINASTCDLFYNPVNHPIVFDISLPAGVKK